MNPPPPPASKQQRVDWLKGRGKGLYQDFSAAVLSTPIISRADEVDELMSSTLLSSFLSRKRLAANQTERRQLEPICKSLQAHQDKLALRTATKLLEKSPDYHIAKALRAICLFRLARYQESLAVCDALASNSAALSDAGVLLFVGWVYTETGRPQDALEMMDEASRLHGGNEDVGVEAFCYFARRGEVKRMQQLALKLYKALEQPRLAALQPLPKASATNDIPVPKYLYWCLMSIILQALALPPLHPTVAVLCSLGARLVTSARGLIGAKEMALGDSAQEFFIRTRLIAVRARGWKRPASTGSAPPPTTSPLPAGSSDADYARAELLNAFVGPDGNKWCDRYLHLELWRREQEWEVGGEHEWERGRGRCMKKLREGDTNWSTIVYLIRFTLKLYHAHRSRALAREANGQDGHDTSSSSASSGCEQDTSSSEEGGEVQIALAAPRSEDEASALTPTAPSSNPVSPGYHMVTELLRWTYDRLYSLAHPPEQRALKAKARRAKGKGKVAEVGSDSEEEQERVKQAPRRERGFLLGLLELVRLSRLEDVPTPSENAATLPELICDYMTLFGDKMCCFDDLQPHLAAQTADERAFVSGSELSFAGALNQDDNAVSVAYSDINAAKIRRYLLPDQDRSVQRDEHEATRYLAAYFANLNLGKGLPETDLQPADDFALLAAHCFVSAWRSSGTTAYLAKAIVVLEFVLRRSPYKYQARVLLIRLYLMLGAVRLAHQHYETLDAKQVQHDTLSHLLMTRASMFSLAAVGDASFITEAAAAVRWYRSGETEATEAYVRTWEDSIFSKIEEYAEFRERLKHSLCKRLLQLEHVRMRLLQAPVNDADLPFIQGILREMATHSGEFWHDNRDTSVLASFQPLGAETVGEATNMGPWPRSKWALSMARLYSAFLRSSSDSLEWQTPPELASPVKPSLAHYVQESAEPHTTAERSLVDFQLVVSQWLESTKGADAPRPVSAGADQLSAFFAARLADVKDVLSNPQSLAWQAAHVAQIALEAYCLLETAISLVPSLSPSSTPTPGAAPRSRSSSAAAVKASPARNLAAKALDQCRVPLHAIATTLSTHAATLKLGTAVSSVADLSTFALLDGFADSTVASLFEAQRTFYRGLSEAIMTRTRSRA